MRLLAGDLGISFFAVPRGHTERGRLMGYAPVSVVFDWALEALGGAILVFSLDDAVNT